MGTNYYLVHDAFPSASRIHIGKSSAGWCFSLHVYPEDGISTLEDWMQRFDLDGWKIVDEYDEQISRKSMIDYIEERVSNTPWDARTWVGYNNEADFHSKNNSERGPSGMLRHKISERCIGHGVGTWDLVVGEFS